MIAIVDTGGANIASLTDAFTRLGARAELTADPKRIRRARGVVLPGVGAAADSMAKIEARGLVAPLKALSVPVLGICLGMQLLFDASEEGDVRCLGLLPGRVRRLKPKRGLRVPHMGWNQVRRRSACGLLEGVEDSAWFYFVHSYAAPDGDYVEADTDYGREVPAIVRRERIFGVQFHPERSAAAGSRLLANFLALTR